MTKHKKKRGRLLIHIPGAWSYPSKKQVTPTHSVNVCMFYLEILCDQALECSVNSKRYIFLPSKVSLATSTEAMCQRLVAKVVHFFECAKKMV